MNNPSNYSHQSFAVQPKQRTIDWDHGSSHFRCTKECKVRPRHRRVRTGRRPSSTRCLSALVKQYVPNKCAHFVFSHYGPKIRNDGARSAEAPARLRGGGSNEFVDTFLKSDTDFVWRNNRFTMPTRLEGGGCGNEASAVGPAVGKLQLGRNNYSRNIEDNTNPACHVGNRCCRKNSDKIPLKQPVFHSENDTECVSKKKEYGVCMKNPCLGTECLIRAFKDTQDFVNAIGKVPGLAGLGITESPYFGKPPEPKEKRTDSKPSNVKQTEEKHHNSQDMTKKNNTPPAQPNPSGNKKTGVVQEATTTYNDPTQASKSKKKEDKIEKQKESENNGPPVQINDASPCGEPKCKSRPKKAVNNNDNGEENRNNSPIEKSSKNDQKNSKAKLHSGFGGDLRKSSKSTNEFVYSFGNSYPTSVYGHKNCNHLRRRVPAKQGWMWNEADTIANRKVRTGWKPGAITVLLRDMMNAAKAGFLNERPKSAPSRSKKNQKVMPFNTLKKPAPCNEEQTEEEANFPPTLHIHRRDGDYYITMYPIRQETSDVPRVDEPLNPLQFKIVKSKDSLASSSTASDMEIEFSPPAAVNRIKKKPNVVHVETNVIQQEILDELKLDDAGKDDKDGAGKSKKEKKNKSKKECI